MFNLKAILALFFLVLFSNIALAQYHPRPHPRPMPPGRVPPPPHYPRPHVVCSATDRGWEEHWNGHPSCGACLQHHSSCIETCAEVFEVCEAHGQTYNGTMIAYRAAGPDRWTAEREALRRCEWDRNVRYCRVVSCQTERRTVSNRSCR